MKRITKKKLELAAETLRILSNDDELKLVIGGAGNTENARCVSGSRCVICRPTSDDC